MSAGSLCPLSAWNASRVALNRRFLTSSLSVAHAPTIRRVTVGRRELLARALPWVLGFAAVAGLVVVYAESIVGFFVDVVVYRSGGQAVLDHRALYDWLAADVALPFTYPPFAALLFVPLAPLGATAAQLAWTTVSVAALTRSSWLIARAASFGAWSLRQRFTIVVGTAALMEPVYATFAFGQINLVIMWLVLEDFIGAVPARWRGSLIGIATGIKIVPGLFIIYLAVTRRLRDAGRAAAAFGATVLLGAVLGVSQSWSFWTGTAYDPQRTGPVAILSNQSTRGVLLRLRDGSLAWLDGSTLISAQFLVSVMMVGVGLWTARRWFLRGEQLLSVALVGLTSLLVSPISWSHHWIWLLPLVFGLLTAPRSRLLSAVAVAVIVVPTARVIWWVPHQFDRVYDYHGLTHVVADAYFIVGIFALVGCAIEARRVSRLNPPEAPASRQPTAEFTPPS